MSGVRLEDRIHAPVLPTRVIDVGEDIDYHPRLLVTGGARGQYLALSYCWGKADVTKTVLSNLDAFQSELLLQDLPQTIQDAILVTKMLGYRYLWVDSLCILQDVKADWEKESKCMAQIYQYALYTIAASASKHANSGLFMPRSDDEDCPIVQGLRFARNLPSLAEDLRSADWDDRAWVRNERDDYLDLEY